MKRTILPVVCALLTSCAIHTSVGPKPDIKPAVASNQATQKDIRDVRAEIKGSQVNLKAGASALEIVDQYLRVLLNQPPKEQPKMLMLAQQELHRGMSEFAQAALRIANADKRASDAELHASFTGTALDSLGVEITKAYEREKTLAKDNAKMKPVYEECTKWWDLGSGLYFVKHLIKHLLILAAVAVGVAAALAIAASLGVPGLGFALRGLGWLKSWLLRAVSRNHKHLGQ